MRKILVEEILQNQIMMHPPFVPFNMIFTLTESAI